VKKLLSLCLIIISLIVYQPRISSASPVSGCGASPASAISIFMKSLTTLYNVFPITLGGVPIIPGPSGLLDIPIGGSPVCICFKGPVPVPGLKLGFWLPIAMVETVHSPFCSPSLGMQIPINLLGLGAGGEHKTKGGKQNHRATMQAHYIKYPTFAILNLLTDIICLQNETGLDIGYLTEIDPLWQNDALSLIINPEAILFGNPVTQIACAADSVAATIGFSLDPLFWCNGSWGSAYPLTGHVRNEDYTQANAAIVDRLLFKMHRELLLWGSLGSAGLCGVYPMPIMRKSQYNIFPVYPVGYPLRLPLGRTGLMWDSLQNLPIPKHNSNFVWAVYDKINCCIF